jgi:hypothetical protein
MFGAFMPVFSVLSVEILKCVISCVTDEGVRVRGAVHEEFVCKVVDELADWNHLEVGVKGSCGSAVGKVTRRHFD